MLTMEFKWAGEKKNKWFYTVKAWANLLLGGTVGCGEIFNDFD